MATAHDCHYSAPSLLPAALRSQLLRDMQHWRPRSITRAMLTRSESDTRAVIAIVNGSLYMLQPMAAARNPLLTAVLRDLAALAADFHLPDVILPLNVFDEPVEPLRRRPLPVFSFFQTRAAADILMPSGYFRHLQVDRLLLGTSFYRERYPWATKRPSALWRGSLFCGANRFLKCSRLVLAHLSAQRAAPELDVRFTSYRAEHDPYLFAQNPEPAEDLPRPPSRLREASRVPPLAHAASRWLVHLDGFTASSRLQLLLATNSVVLKQDSYFWAHYHSAFRPHVHYVPFWEASHLDIVPVLANASHPSRDAEMRRLGERASSLAHRLFSRRARSLYWLTLLHLFARRLHRRPDLALWPLAMRWVDRAPARRAAPADGVARCDGDEAAAISIADQLEETIARVQRAGREPRARPAAAATIPPNGNAALGLHFESDAEARCMPPETDHAALRGTREAFDEMSAKNVYR